MKRILNLLFLLFCLQFSKAQISLGDYTAVDEKYGNLGSLHNTVLGKVYMDMPLEKGMGYDKAINYIAAFSIKSFLQNAKPTQYLNTDPSLVEKEFEKRKFYVDQKKFTEQLLSDEGENSLNGNISEISKRPILSTDNQLILSKFSSLIKANLRLQMSPDVFEQSVVNLYNEWIKFENEPGGEMLGEMFAISLKSCEWWRKNPEAGNEPKKMYSRKPPASFMADNSPMLAQVVALDAAGALVGACSAALNTYLNTGSVHWGAVGTAAVIGAVTGSTGLVGKIGKWLSSLF